MLPRELCQPAFTDINQKRQKAPRPKWLLADVVFTLSESHKIIMKLHFQISSRGRAVRYMKDPKQINLPPKSKVAKR